MKILCILLVLNCKLWAVEDFGLKADIQGVLRGVNHIHCVTYEIPCSWSKKLLVYKADIYVKYFDGNYVISSEKLDVLFNYMNITAVSELKDERILLVSQETPEFDKSVTYAVILDAESKVLTKAPITPPANFDTIKVEETAKGYKITYFDKEKVKLGENDFESGKK